MNIDVLLEQVTQEPSALPDLVEQLSELDVSALVDGLKTEADRHWYINANRSLELAELIEQVGRASNQPRHTAMGMMARGDALRFLGQIEAAWNTLDAAGQLFRQAGHEVGWARTRIGRLLCCVELNRVAEALSDAKLAEEIFTRHNLPERLLALANNTAIVHDLLGDYQRALTLYHSALATAEALGDRGEWHIALLSIDIGYSHRMLGDIRQALAYYERARAIFVQRDDIRGIALAELNIGYIAMMEGQHRQALQLLHHARDLYLDEQLPLDATHACRVMVESYLLLNRYDQARDLARQVSQDYQQFGASYKAALTLLHLAVAEAELSSFDAAQSALDAAQALFESLGAATWVATTQLRRGRIALQQGDIATARVAARAAIACFESNDQQVDLGAALFLHGQTLFADGDLVDAAMHSASALRIARHSNNPPLRYGAHLLLGHIADARADRRRARRHYTAAVATVERVQRGLTITLRPGFLEDKGEALRALIGLHLRSGQAACAFETLEQAKSQALLSYLGNREQFRWAGDDPHNRTLIAELNNLRQEHQWFYRLAQGQAGSEDAERSGVDPQQARAEVAARERRMRAITEQLYLHSAGSVGQRVNAPTLEEVQRSLDEHTTLIEYYNDGAQLWAFTVDARSLDVHPLPIQVAALDQTIAKIQANLTFALNSGPYAPATQRLIGVIRSLLQQLHAALVQPLAPHIGKQHRLVVVPYGALHYLPFHLLHDGSAYLIEQREVLALPASSLAARRAPTRAAGALALAHSWEGRLPHTLAEARIVEQLFAGNVYAEQEAQRGALCVRPTQILHIAAHGEHRLDQPDLSYIQLADGQLYADDLLQHDMSYELVTLSACETGRANVAAGDELIGLGRGFLYAGAGALMTSLWRVVDDVTFALMERFYVALRAGASKAAALRDAQRSILAEQPELHPAFWGAFQLVGDAAPLSVAEPLDRMEIIAKLVATGRPLEKLS